MSSKTPKENKMGHGNQRPMLNLPELLYLFWLPAISMIQSKKKHASMETLFPIKSPWEYLDAQGQLTP